MDLLTRFEDFHGDWVLVGPGLAEDEGLTTAVVLSLFSDARAQAGDVLPDGGTDRRGWWGDAFADEPGDRFGSRLWLLHREKQLAQVLPRAKQYAEEALRWLVEDGIASSVAVITEFTRPGVLGMGVEIRRALQAPVAYRFESSWNASHAA